MAKEMAKQEHIVEPLVIEAHSDIRSNGVVAFRLIATQAGIAYLDSLKTGNGGASPVFFDNTKSGGLKATLLIINPKAKGKEKRQNSVSVGF